MKLFCKLAILMLSLLFISPAAYALEIEDQSLIISKIEDYVDAWNSNRGVGFGNSFTHDADFINIFGMHFSGREEIETRHVYILNTFLRNSTLKVDHIQLREALPGVVIAIVKWTVNGFGKAGKTRQGIFSHSFINVDGDWLITATQNTLLRNKRFHSHQHHIR